MMSNKNRLVAYVDKKYLFAFRVTMLLVSLPFFYDIFMVLASGIADSGGYIFKRGEHWGYYAYLFKESSFAFLFVWLGTLGSKETPNK
ncbi:hypothetical protein [Pseudidiomarina salilacus]|uniref:hypothetical protein n=1 Tax=Pseudidiomarina salilacus TaxID=3384452 RepID=UPI003984824C